MKILRIIFLFVLINVFGTLFASVDGDNWWNETQISTEGKEFYLTFMQNYGKNVGAEDLVLTLYATSHYDTYVTVEGIWTDEEDASISYPWDTTFFVSRNSYGSVIIPSQVAYLDKPKSENAENLNKGIRVISDNYITLYSSSTNTNSYDATIVYPSTTYHREYVIQTYPTDNQSNEFAIVSVADNNKVTIRVRKVDNKKNADRTPIETEEIVVTLHQGQSYLYQPARKEISLIGSTVCSEYPVAVMQGGQHAKIPQGNSETSHIYNNTLPTKAWGKRHIVTRTAEQRYDYISLLASEDGTKVYCNNSLIAEIGSKEAFQDTIDWNLFSSGSVYYYTSKSTECFIFQSANKSSQGAPTMTDITPLESAIQRVLFACFDYRYTSEDIYDIDHHYVNIVLPKSCIGGMTIDGRAIHPKDFKDVPYLVDGIGYSYTCQKISKGSHELKNTMGGFVAHVYGQGNVEDVGEITYSYSAGRNILPAAWMLIDGKRTNRKEICEGSPIKFTSVINYDYTDIRWEFHDLNGEVKVIETSKTASGDSVITKTYFDIPRGATLEEHIDSVFMIVTRQTPICNYIIKDTIKAVIQVRDTFMIDENYEYDYNENVCYGDTVRLHYKGQDIVIPADTLHSYKYGNKWFKFQLNDSISFVDSLKTNNSCDTCLHCDSIINQIRIIRPTYDTLLYDTTCVNKLPYIWLDKNGNLINDLDLSEEEKKTLYLTKEHTFASKQIKDTVMMSTQYGCDSLVRIQLTVLPVYHFEDYATVCVDSLRGYTWMGHTGNGKTVYLDGQTPKTYIPLNQDGTFVYVDSLKTKGCKNCELASEGCDSIWTLHLTVLPRSINEEFETICSDNYVVWQDSLWILGWDFLESEVPDGQAYTKLYQSYKKFEVNYKTKDEFECDSTVILHLFIKSVSRLDTTYYLCKGETYVDIDFIDITATNDTSFVKRLIGANAVGCDSVVYVTVKFGENYDVDDSSVVLCERDSMYIWEYQDSYGSYSDTLKWSDLHEQVLDTVLYDTLHTASPFYCDSVVSKRVVVNPTTYNKFKTVWCASAGPYTYGEKGKTATTSGIYIDTLITKNQYNCDSVVEVNLTIVDSILINLYDTVCDNDLPYNHSDTRAERLLNLTKTGVYIDTLQSINGCDSVLVLHLQVNETYESTDTIFICASDANPYQWHTTDRNGVHVMDIPFTPDFTINQANKVPFVVGDSSIMLESQFGCDSLVHLHLVVQPTYLFVENDTLCQLAGGSYEWIRHERDIYSETLQQRVSQISLDNDGDFVYIDSLKTHVCDQCPDAGCDSIYQLHLKVLPTYTLIDTVVKISDEETFKWHENGLVYGGASTREIYDVLIPTCYPDTFKTQVTYHTVPVGSYTCDSVRELKIVVGKVTRDTTVDETCSNLEYAWLGKDRFGNDSVRMLITNPETKIYTDVYTTSLGFDSIFYLDLTVHPAYVGIDTMKVYEATCQNSDYTWIRENNHGFPTRLYNLDTKLWIDANKIPTDIPGDYTYIDSLKTEYGCDSVWTLHLRVDSTYLFNDTMSMCDDEYVVWENRLYVGSKCTDTNLPVCGTVIHVQPQWDYRDTVRMKTCTGCDSIRTLSLNIHALYDVVFNDSICDNADSYIWITKDQHGIYEDTVYFTANEQYVDAVTGIAKKDYIHITDKQRMLKSVYGCDSLVHLHLVVLPTYFFLTDTSICSNEYIEYRGHRFNKDTIFTDPLLTKSGCDSIYQLRLHIKPSFLFERRIDICDNEMAYHQTPTGEEILWRPGDYKPGRDEYIYLRYETELGCDSVYKYRVVVHPTYLDEQYYTICSTDSVKVHDGLLFKPNTTYYSMQDTIMVENIFITDTLCAEHVCRIGDNEDAICCCDSIYNAHIRILSAYKNIEYDTICSNEIYSWHDRSLNESIAGTYVYYDSLLTVNGCDSIYELYLTVLQAYDIDVYDTICADEYYYVGDLAFNKAGVYLDTLRTIHDCDSVVHLYLTILDTTIVETYDTICVTEEYYYFGQMYDKPGVYDTITLNDWGCKQYNYLHLEVIDTTAYEISIGDVICADDEEIWVEYEWLSGRRLIEYSVFFNDYGHSQGFEDIIHAPLDTTVSYFSIPIPRGEDLPMPNPSYFDSQQGVNSYVNETKQKYPAPNEYTFRLVMHNGICGDNLQRKDTIISFWYPSWIHEQHWNDGVVLYNDTYNGGYKFSSYQWYQNGKPLVGETKEYLYLPNGLLLNNRGDCDNYYQVLLTREEDGYSALTCPICPIYLENDTIVPQLDYFSIVPTLVLRENPVVHILSTMRGTCVGYDMVGNLLFEPFDFIPDGNNYAGAITLPVSQSGMISIRLSTQNGESRVFKILVK